MGGKVLELESDKLIAKGKQETQVETAVRMLQAGKYTIEEIADISGLTIEKIYELKAEKNLQCISVPLLTSPTNKSNMNYNAMAR